MFGTKILYLLLIALFTCQASSAQIKRRQTRQKASEVKAEQPSKEDLLYENMLSSTAQVMIIDSIVTDKKSFLDAIILSKESGTIGIYDKETDDDGCPESYVYINEFGNKMFFSKPGPDGVSRLYMADKLEGEWQNQRLITDFDDDFTDISHPFMMSDGITLYFSAKSKNGLGGHDIYVTMYDVDSARFYKPENIGLPYNSRANDYYYVVDEFNALGWLVTDRNQPEGKVCIYVFVPSSSRNVYDGSMDEKKLKSLAEIRRIKDTWTSQNELKAARERLDNVLKKKETEKQSIGFVINDNTVYSSLEEFKLAANKERYSKLCAMKENAAKTEEKLDAYRRTYSSGDARLKKQLSGDIRSMEKKLENLYVSIHSLEKEIRNAEIRSKAR